MNQFDGIQRDQRFRGFAGSTRLNLEAQKDQEEFGIDHVERPSASLSWEKTEQDRRICRRILRKSLLVAGHIAATKSGSVISALSCSNCVMRAAIPVYIEAA